MKQKKELYSCKKIIGLNEKQFFNKIVFLIIKYIRDIIFIGGIMEIFKKTMIENEEKFKDLTYICKKGNIPVIITAAHTMVQLKKDGQYKENEPFTKAMCIYISENTNCFYLIKNKDTGIDSNNSLNDTFKNMLLDIIKDNNIKLVIDIHGAKEDRNFDIELGTLNNLSSDYSTIKELIDSFEENGINNIEINNPFKGGSITQKVFSETSCDVIQLEINAKYRNILNADKMKQVCDSLSKFVKQYSCIIDK